MKDPFADLSSFDKLRMTSNDPSTGSGLRMTSDDKKERRKKNAFKEYMKLCGIESKIYSDPVEQLLKRG